MVLPKFRGVVPKAPLLLPGQQQEKAKTPKGHNTANKIWLGGTTQKCIAVWQKFLQVARHQKKQLAVVSPLSPNAMLNTLRNAKPPARKSTLCTWGAGACKWTQMISHLTKTFVTGVHKIVSNTASAMKHEPSFGSAHKSLAWLIYIRHVAHSLLVAKQKG